MPTKKRKRKREPHGHEHHNLSPLLSSIASALSTAHSFLSENELLLLPSQTLTLESQLASCSLSLSHLHSLLPSSSPPPPPPPLSSSSSHFSPTWFQRFLSFSSSDPTKWTEAFRMSKPSFDLLLQTLSPSLPHASHSHLLLAAALFRLAHGASYKAVGRRFGLHSAVACRAFYDVCKAVIDRLADLLEPQNGGFGCFKVQNCCGGLGFSRFLVDGGDGGDGSVIVQALVDWEGRFLDVSAGWPGSIEPSAILRRSKLFSRVEESKELLNGPVFEAEDGTLVPQFVFGEASCPLLPWLMTPFPADCESNFFEEAFNSVHGEGMGVVRRAFGRVRSRWRLLSMKWKKESVEFLPFVVVTACLLHNFLLKCGEVGSDENVVDDGFEEEDWGFAEFGGKGDESGERIRNALASQLGLVSQRN